MIDFEEELKKFRPSKEVEHLENVVNHMSIKDMTDIMQEIMKEKEQRK